MLCTRDCGADGGAATDYDDSAPIVHFLGGCLNTNECATNIDGDHTIEFVDAKAINRAASKNAGIADEKCPACLESPLLWPQHFEALRQKHCQP
jgi:hypothetical protein